MRAIWATTKRRLASRPRSIRELLWRARARRTTAAFSALSRRRRTPRRPPASSTPRDPRIRASRSVSFANWSQASSVGARSCASAQRVKSKRSTGTSVSWTRRSARQGGCRRKRCAHREAGRRQSPSCEHAVDEKDVHIGKLDQTLVEFKDAIGAKDAANRRAGSTAPATLSAEHVQLEESTRRTAALERELQVDPDVPFVAVDSAATAIPKGSPAPHLHVPRRRR